MHKLNWRNQGETLIELAIRTVAPAPAGASADVARTKTPRKHILVLDDDSAFVELLRALFVDDG